MYRLRASTWQPVDWGFIPSRVILKTLKIVFAAFAPGARHKRKCEGFCVCVVRHVMSLNSVQSFVIENCNWPTIENGLNNVCLHPLSRTFTFTFFTATAMMSSLTTMMYRTIFSVVNCSRYRVQTAGLGTTGQQLWLGPELRPGFIQCFVLCLEYIVK